MTPEQHTTTPEQSADALSYTKQLEAELSKAKSPIEEASAVNIVLGKMMMDAEAGAVRKVIVDAKGKETVTVYDGPQMMRNLAEFYSMIDPSEDGLGFSLEAAINRVPRAGGLRNVMAGLLDANADPIRKEATMYWLKRNYEETKQRFPEAHNDEADIATRPRQEVMDMIAQAGASEEVVQPVEAAVEHEASAEELVLEEEMGEVAVEQVVEEPGAEPVEQLFTPEAAPEQENPQPESEEAEDSEEDQDNERMERRKLENSAEEVSRMEQMVMRRIDDFADETRRLTLRLESDNYPAGAVGKLIQSHAESLPSMIVMLRRLEEDSDGFKIKSVGESSVLPDDAQQLIRQRIETQKVEIDEQVSALQTLFRMYDIVAQEAFRGVPVLDDVRQLEASAQVIKASIDGFSLRRTLQENLN